MTPEIDLSFDGRAGAVQDVVLAPSIRMVEWTSGVLLVRLHTKGSWTSSSANAQVLVMNTSIAPEEPHTLFPGSTIATAQINQGDTAPKLYEDDLTGAIADTVRVLVRWNQGASAGTAAFTLSIGVDLVVRA